MKLFLFLQTEKTRNQGEFKYAVQHYINLIAAQSLRTAKATNFIFTVKQPLIKKIIKGIEYPFSTPLSANKSFSFSFYSNQN